MSVKNRFVDVLLSVGLFAGRGGASTISAYPPFRGIADQGKI
jgi:hypothetical protein